MLKFYVSKNNNRLNRRPWVPEYITDNLCLNPIYKTVRIYRGGGNVLLDSGAFQDVDKDKRLTYEEALNRQLNFEQAAGFVSQRIVSYDRLVDEQLKEGKKVKCRVDEDNGWEYVKDTVGAAQYLVSQRDKLAPRQLVLSNQGTTTEQYLTCLKEVLRIAQPQDCIGMGGFCIIGARKTLQPQFFEIQEKSFPLIKDAGITDIHLFGVTAIPVLERWVEIARPYDFNLSVDSSSAERRSVFGGVFSPDTGKWEAKYTRQDKYINYHPRDLALINTINFRDYLEGIA